MARCNQQGGWNPGCRLFSAFTNMPGLFAKQGHSLSAVRPIPDFNIKHAAYSRVSRRLDMYPLFVFVNLPSALNNESFPAYSLKLRACELDPAKTKSRWPSPTFQPTCAVSCTYFSFFLLYRTPQSQSKMMKHCGGRAHCRGDKASEIPPGFFMCSDEWLGLKIGDNTNTERCASRCFLSRHGNSICVVTISRPNVPPSGVELDKWLEIGDSRMEWSVLVRRKSEAMTVQYIITSILPSLNFHPPTFWVTFHLQLHLL